MEERGKLKIGHTKVANSRQIGRDDALANVVINISLAATWRMQ